MSCKDSKRLIKEHEGKAVTSQKWQQMTQVNLVGEVLPIISTEVNTKGIDMPHNDPLVIELDIKDFMVIRVLTDTSSLVDLIYKETPKKMGIEDLKIKPIMRRLTGFTTNL